MGDNEMIRDAFIRNTTPTTDRASFEKALEKCIGMARVVRIGPTHDDPNYRAPLWAIYDALRAERDAALARLAIREDRADAFASEMEAELDEVRAERDNWMALAAASNADKDTALRDAAAIKLVMESQDLKLHNALAQVAALREVLAGELGVCRLHPSECYPHQVLADTATAAAARDAELVCKPYAERNMLVGALSKMFPAWIKSDPNEPDWPVVIVQLPTGQVSWHITAQERYSVFPHLNANISGDAEWDGHDDVEKWRRVCTLPERLGAELVRPWREECLKARELDSLMLSSDVAGGGPVSSMVLAEYRLLRAANEKEGRT